MIARRSTAFPKSVNAAVRAGLDQSVVNNATSDGFNNADTQTAIVPGTSGTTGLADLLSAVVSADGNHISYTFDKPIGAAPDPQRVQSPSSADGRHRVRVPATPTISNTATTGTVTVSFASGSQFNEYDVKACGPPGAVTVLNQPAHRQHLRVGSRGRQCRRVRARVHHRSGRDRGHVQQHHRPSGDHVRPAAGPDLPRNDPAGFVLLDSNGTPVAGANATGVTGARAPLVRCR